MLPHSAAAPARMPPADLDGLAVVELVPHLLPQFVNEDGFLPGHEVEVFGVQQREDASTEIPCPDRVTGGERGGGANTQLLQAPESAVVDAVPTVGQAGLSQSSFNSDVPNA